MTEIQAWKIAMLGTYGGFSANFIAQRAFNVSKPEDVEPKQRAAVYRQLKKVGVSLRDYRNGRTKDAKANAAVLISRERRQAGAA